MTAYSNFIPDTPVRLVATPATTSKIVSRTIIDGVPHFVVKADSNGAESTVRGSLLEPNPGTKPAEDTYPAIGGGGS